MRNHVIAQLALFLAAPAAAGETMAQRVAAHEAPFASSRSTGLSPVSTGEMLQCAALWNRWKYTLSSAATPEFETALRPELQSASARSREFELRRQARRGRLNDDDDSYFNEVRAEGEAFADKIHAAYVKNEPKSTEAFMEWLGTC
ncbi:MAG: hypothetical protein OSB00_16465 [Sphingomonas bacterium]|nr:hypothetical protein [Sphingomonas bacterium]